MSINKMVVKTVYRCKTLRNNNLNKINQYYNSILGQYKNNYSNYLTKINSTDNDDKML